MLAYVCIWLRTHNWNHFVRRTAITYSFTLFGALAADLVRIVEVLSPPAMIAYARCLGTPPVAYCCDQYTIWCFFT